MAQDVDLCVAFYKAVKRQSFCLLCQDPTIQYHHVRPADKISEVSRIAKIGNMGLLIAEFNKVVPLCDSDHRAVHLGKIKGWMDGVTVHGGPSHDREARKFMPFLERLEVVTNECAG